MMYRSRRALNVNEIVLELEDIDSNTDKVDIIIIPPEVDQLSDEDEPASSNIIGSATVSDIIGTLELHHTDNTPLGIENISSRKKKRTLTNFETKWR